MLEEDGGPVFESAALILHLADQNLDAGLIGPLGSHERGLQYQWCFFGMTEMRGRADGHRPPALDGRRAGRRHRRARDGAVRHRVPASSRTRSATTTTSSTNAFSVADIVVGSVLGFARTGELTELPAGVVAVRRPARGTSGTTAGRRRRAPGLGLAARMRLRPAAIRAMGRAHRAVYRLSGGRLLGRVAGMPVLLLTTTGRRTGRARTTPLTYFEVGDELAIVASNGGEDSPPRWWLNLQADAAGHDHDRRRAPSRSPPGRRPPTSMRELWPVITTTHPGYAALRAPDDPADPGRAAHSGPKKMHRIGSPLVQLPDQSSLALQSLGRPSTSGAPCSVHW